MQLCNTQLKADWNPKADVFCSKALDGTKGGKPRCPLVLISEITKRCTPFREGLEGRRVATHEIASMVVSVFLRACGQLLHR